jgi:hypothetical protein
MVEEWGIGEEELRRRRLVEVWWGIGKDLGVVRKTMNGEEELRKGFIQREDNKWSKRCIFHGPPLCQGQTNAAMATPNNT